jgi:hypothetical protein
MIYTITLTDVQDKALRLTVADPQDWIENAVFNRCRIAIDDIATSETARMIADPAITSIPADKATLVMQAEFPAPVEPSLPPTGG